MKELEELKSDNKEIVAPVPRSKKNLGWVSQPHPGMVLYAVDKATEKVEAVKSEATTPAVNVVPGKKEAFRQLELARKEIHHKVVNDPTKWYVWAINQANALRKYRQAKQLEKQNLQQ